MKSKVKDKAKTYAISEVFYSLQGEGVRSGEASIFLRFAGCNLDCNVKEHGFDCDTDFSLKSKMDLETLIATVESVADSVLCRWVVLTGGEPALQVTKELIDALHNCGFLVAIETNGTKPLPSGIDWICVSPKTPDDTIVIRECQELKYVVALNDPIPDTDIKADHYVLSPAWMVESKTDPKRPGVLLDTLQAYVINLCLENPMWRYSEQKHKHWKVR